MLIVKKGNRQYKIDDRDKEKYKKAGYSIINEKGKVLESAELTIKEELKALRKENAELKAKLKAQK